MKKIDVIIQGLFFLAALISFPMLLVEDDSLMLLLAAQFWLGIYQLISAFIKLVLRKHLLSQASKLLKYYWVITLIYLAITTLGSLSINYEVVDIGFVFPRWAFIVWWVVIPWSIASFYLYISYIDTFKKLEMRSELLPNIYIKEN